MYCLERQRRREGAQGEVRAALGNEHFNRNLLLPVLGQHCNGSAEWKGWRVRACARSKAGEGGGGARGWGACEM